MPEVYVSVSLFQEKVKQARKKRVEVVGTTWVIESIVSGEVASLDSFRVETKE